MLIYVKKEISTTCRTAKCSGACLIKKNNKKEIKT
jgi:hypothetical protein